MSSLPKMNRQPVSLCLAAGWGFPESAAGCSLNVFDNWITSAFIKIQTRSKHKHFPQHWNELDIFKDSVEVIILYMSISISCYTIYCISIYFTAVVTTYISDQHCPISNELSIYDPFVQIWWYFWLLIIVYCHNPSLKRWLKKTVF